MDALSNYLVHTPKFCSQFKHVVSSTTCQTVRQVLEGRDRLARQMRTPLWGCPSVWGEGLGRQSQIRHFMCKKKDEGESYSALRPHKDPIPQQKAKWIELNVINLPLPTGT